MRNRWLLCPYCRSKTRVQTRDDTIMMHFPLFCPKCRRESIVTVKNGKIILIEEPDAAAQSR